MVTWDSYNLLFGKNDVFFININSTGFYWDLGMRPAVDLFCAEVVDSGTVLPGKSLTFGGLEWGDGIICGNTSDFITIEYFEPDSTKTVYLSMGLDTRPDLSPHAFPSWGSFVVDIDADNRVFDPSPWTASTKKMVMLK